MSTIDQQLARATQELEEKLNLIEQMKANQKSSVGRSLARGTKNAALGAIDVADFLASPIREGMNLGFKAFGSDRHIKPLAEESSQAIDRSTQGYTQSHTPSQKTEEAIVRGLGSMIPGVGAGRVLVQGAGKASKALGNALVESNTLTPTNIVGTAATTGAMQHYANENPDDILGQIGAGIVGGMGTNSAIGARKLATAAGRKELSERFASNMGNRLKLNPSAIEDFQAAGIDPTLADVSDRKLAKVITHNLGYIPGSSGTIEKAHKAQRNKILEGLGQGDYGDALSKAKASALTKKGAKGYQQEENKKFSKMFGQLEEDLNQLPSTNIMPKQTLSMFEDLRKPSRKTGMYKLYEKAIETPYGKVLKDVYDTSTQHGGAIPYEYLKQTLDNINDQITTHGLVGKKSQGELKKIAAAVASDIEHGMTPKFKALGEDSYNNWIEANKHYSLYAQNEIPNLNQLFKADKKGATDAFLDLMTNQKKGAEKAKIVLKELKPKDQVDLTQAIHKHLGESTDGSFSSLKWVRGFKKLEPDAQKVLLSPLKKDTQQKFHAIADVMDHIKGTLAEANTSKTAYYTALGTMGSASWSATSSLFHGNIIPAAALGTGLIVARLGAEALTNPKLINWMYNGMRMKSPAQFETHVKRLQRISGVSKATLREAQAFERDLNK